MGRNKDHELAYHILNKIIELAKQDVRVSFTGDSFEEITVYVGPNGLNHFHISGDGSRSGLLEAIDGALDSGSRNLQLLPQDADED